MRLIGPEDYEALEAEWAIGSPEQPPSLGHKESELLKNAKLATFHDGPLGLGLRFEPQVSGVVISSVDDGSQAAEAGVVVGDIVIGVDGAPTRNRPKETVLMMIKAASRPFEMRLIGPEEYEALETASKAAEAGGAAPSPSSMSREGAVGQRFSCSNLGAELSEVGGLVDSAPGLDLTEDSMVEPSNAAERI